MATTPDINVRGILDLIASDLAYKPGIQPGILLQTFPDNNASDENGFPVSLALNLGDQPLTQKEFFEQGGVTGIRLPQWEVVQSFETSGDGYGAVIFKSKLRGADGKFDYIVAFRGTDGIDRQDWFANLDLASTLWKDHSAQLVGYLTSLQSDNDKPSLNRVHFTGQSLGGGLAQYAAYDYALAVKDTNPDFRRDMTLTTFNGFGGVRGLQQLAGDAGRPTAYDPSLLSGVTTAHYSIENDLVHRIGKGAGDVALVGGSWHVNGLGNTYALPFRRVSNGIPVLGPQNFLDLFDAHRIEPGFYRGFQNFPGDFLSAKPENIQYIDSDASRSLGAAISRIGNKGFTTETSAGVRFAVGVAAIAVAGNTIEIAKAASAWIKTRFNAGQTNSPTSDTVALVSLAIGTRLVATNALLPTTALAAWYATYLERAAGLTSSEKSEAFRALNSFMPSYKQISERSVATDAAQSNAEREVRFHLAAAAFASQLDNETDVKSILSDSNEIALSKSLKMAQVNPDQLSAVLLGLNPRKGLEDAVSEALTSASLTAEQKIFLATAVAGQTQEIANKLGVGDSSYLALTRQETREFLTSLGKSLSNVSSELRVDQRFPDGTNPMFGASLLNFAEYGRYVSGFEQGLNDRLNVPIRNLISEALQLATAAGQSIAIIPGASSNPFDSAGFNPDAGPVPTSGVTDRGANSYTVFIPYAANEGGQHIHMKLEGAAADKLSVIAGGQTLTVTNGEFDLTVTEGQRALTFALLSKDSVTTNTNLTLSATLTDATGNATHLTHNELNLTLAAPADAVTADQAFTNTILGDQNAPDFDDSLGGTDGNDKIIAGQGADIVTGAEGKDWILGGAGQDSVFGDGGNDLIEGGAGSDLLAGGSEDDQIYADAKGDRAAAMNSDATEPGADSDWLDGFDGNDLLVGGTGADVLTGGAGADVLIGGAGNDAIYGDAQTAFSTPDGVIHEELSDVSLEGADDTLFGGGGDDFMRGDVGNDALFGGAGNDRLFGDADSLAASFHGNDYLDGGAGDDILEGQGGNDDLIGGDGDDQLIGASDALALAAHGDDYLEGGAGNDLLRGMGGDDILSGGVGDDELQGDEGADELYGDDGVDTMHGGAGDDYLDGGAGNDLMGGGDGADALFGGDGDDQVQGGEGDDSLDGEEGNDVLLGDAGADTIFGGAGNDQLQGGAGDDALEGEEGEDLLFGEAGSDTLFGGEGNDQLSGGAGDDQLDGETGNDVLFGDDGNDTLFGGEGTDQLQGNTHSLALGRAMN